MSRNLLLLSLVSFLTFTETSAQVKTGTACATYMRRIFYSVEHSAHFTGSLEEYFTTALPDKGNGENGAIKLRLIIDSIGRLDCLTIDSNSTSYTQDEIRNCVDNMPAWLPAKQNGYRVTFCAVLVVTVNRGKKSVSYRNEQQLRRS